MHRVDAFGNLLGVCRKLTEGIESLLGWRKGVRQKKTETRWKIIGVAEKLAKSRDGLVMDILIHRRNQEARWEREGRSSEKRPEDLPQDCRRLSEYAGNLGGDQLLTAGKPPKSMGFDLHPKKIGSGYRCASRRRTQKWT
ncbi:hypothetical protein B296_00018928 [Ensete ventricosum]|uniref:Uncharacterized protein n=1 Tax=Ensete ventricosum TaxID=4639 RepID=A0A426ZZ38_ENSVE|nr:hypothetical protein B296_00018928 [Ensete ventricosum]